ncbi:hypothetical protein KL911_002427 [Ogataea haglerorum]|uniref:uncharacterized protein n=1 Tax=Ogataea haglerorum TaxID=1937702 RepID=UPI001C89FDAD|nr:uncharacterized protein KL911_002427 [Ogataea haglerorum]KAG7753951.1 hypothetical protein KL911_002427 [Ogataea haglerorum]
MGLELFEYRIITKDGFVITLQRIVDPTVPTSGPPVLLLHGLLQSSGSFVTSGYKSLSYLLLRNGYDVWLGNNRCGFHPQHTSLGPNDPKMWDWDLTEMTRYDVPHAAVERVRDRLRGQDLGVRASGAGDFWRFAVELQGLYSFHQAAAQLALRLVFRNQLVHAGHDGSAQNHSHHAGVWVSELRDVQLPVRLDRLSLGQEPETVPFHFLAGVRFGETDEVVAQQAPRTGFPNGQVIAEKRAGVVLEEDAPAVPGDRGARQTGGRQPFRATSGTQGARNARPFQLH